jgi:heme/copper-type cytochrome/quinol oxidase subunit 2
MSGSHLTTRRGFIAAAGFGGVGLYGLWVAYGAAPSPLDWIGGAHGDEAGHAEATPAGAHGAHGAAPNGPSAEEFSREVAAFGERFALTDGSVYPRADAVDHAAMGHGSSHADAADALLVVPMAAGKWYYLPNKLRLDVGRAYRLRMMALDVSHGASIQFGRGGRMLRLRPGRVTELGVRFAQPGRYLMTCTVYCGAAHDAMQATIEVVS